MNKLLAGLSAAVISLALALPALAQSDREVALAIYKNFQAGQALPLASKMRPGLTLAQAYGVQTALVALFRSHEDQVAGYKAGLTSQAVQQRFGAKGPALGVLMASMRRYKVVRRADFRNLALEVEIAYLLGKPISRPVTHRTVREYVLGIAPAVELPDLAYADMSAVTLPDIVAANVVCRGFILGPMVRADKLDPNVTQGQLWRGGKPLTPAVGAKAALGSQWEALAWSVNQALAMYGPLSEGSVILTGSLGPMFPGEPGSYEAVFSGGLGRVAFEVK
ncbi:2-keto-4-pentenoate hydratase [Desulfoferula mesophila]|uniref:Hydratase/decarboxylase n=1 Tax=Desulfoferula mesophila TaxID=3058419 RepID=A0AAU9ESD0_9BACT|nr:putative hydratase/decarboxylase [Desulfoferula mesophilus]